jgi:hypothetical protein
MPERSPVPEHHFLVQAPVAPMDVDGLNVVVTGTLAFTVASVLAGAFYADLAARGDGWWLGVCISGFVLGLVGLLYCWNRRRRRRAGHWNKD